MTGTLGREVISTRQRKIAELAQREPKLTLTTPRTRRESEVEAGRSRRKDAAVPFQTATGSQRAGSTRRHSGPPKDEPYVT